MRASATPADALRKPLLVLAVVANVVALLLCLGSSLVTGPPPFSQRVEQTLSSPDTRAMLERFDVDPDDAEDSLTDTVPDDPPGLGIPALALIQGALCLMLVLIALPLLVGDRITGTVSGIVSILGGLVLLLVSIGVAIASFIKLLVMVGLLLAVPFGTLAYLALFGSFDTGGAAVFTSLILFFTLACLVLLVFAHQRFLTSTGLVLLIASAALLTFVTSLLHSIVPGFLVSITDALAALITAIVSAIWSLLMLVWGVVAAVRLVQLGRQFSGGQLTRDTPPPGRTTR